MIVPKPPMPNRSASCPPLASSHRHRHSSLLPSLRCCRTDSWQSVSPTVRFETRVAALLSWPGACCTRTLLLLPNTIHVLFSARPVEPPCSRRWSRVHGDSLEGPLGMIPLPSRALFPICRVAHRVLEDRTSPCTLYWAGDFLPARWPVRVCGGFADAVWACQEEVCSDLVKDAGHNCHILSMVVQTVKLPRWGSDAPVVDSRLPCLVPQLDGQRNSAAEFEGGSRCTAVDRVQDSRACGSCNLPLHWVAFPRGVGSQLSTIIMSCNGASSHLHH